MAAGMGSRYGGVKQIDAVGKNGECLLDFAAYDAKNADLEKLFISSEKILKKISVSAFLTGSHETSMRNMFSRLQQPF